MTKTTALLCLSLLTAGAAAHAQDAPAPGWYAAPMAIYFAADNARCVDDGLGLALTLGHRGEFASLEGWAQFLSASASCSGVPNGGGSGSLNGGGLALVTGPFFKGTVASRLRALIGFGVIQRNDHPRHDGDDTTIFGDAGVGYVHPLAFRFKDRPVSLRAEARYRYDVQQRPRPSGTPAQYQDVVVQVGVQIPFARPAAPPRPEPVEVVPPAGT